MVNLSKLRKILKSSARERISVKERKISRDKPRATIVVTGNSPLLQKMQRDKARFFKFTREGSFDE